MNKPLLRKIMDIVIELLSAAMKHPGLAACKFAERRLMDFAVGAVYLFLGNIEKMACKANPRSLQWLAGESGILLAGGRA